MLARGSLISAVCILIFLPAILYLCEPVIHKTTLHWRTPRAPRLPRGQASPQEIPAPRPVHAELAEPELQLEEAKL